MKKNNFLIFKSIIKELRISSLLDEELNVTFLGTAMSTELPLYKGNAPYFAAFSKTPSLFTVANFVLTHPVFKLGLIVGTDILWLRKDGGLCVVDSSKVAIVHRVTSLTSVSFDNPILKAHLKGLREKIKLGEMVNVIPRYSTKAEYERLFT